MWLNCQFFIPMYLIIFDRNDNQKTLPWIHESFFVKLFLFCKFCKALSLPCFRNVAIGHFGDIQLQESLASCCCGNCIIEFLNKPLAGLPKSLSCRPWQVYYFFFFEIKNPGLGQNENVFRFAISAYVSYLKCVLEAGVGYTLILKLHSEDGWLLCI